MRLGDGEGVRIRCPAKHVASHWIKDKNLARAIADAGSVFFAGMWFLYFIGSMWRIGYWMMAGGRKSG